MDLTGEKIYQYHWEEWYIYHSELLCYDLDCIVTCNVTRQHMWFFFLLFLKVKGYPSHTVILHTNVHMCIIDFYQEWKKNYIKKN